MIDPFDDALSDDAADIEVSCMDDVALSPVINHSDSSAAHCDDTGGCNVDSTVRGAASSTVHEVLKRAVRER